MRIDVLEYACLLNYDKTLANNLGKHNRKKDTTTGKITVSRLRA